jgi:predicted PurR-regulated permease PerM
MLDRIRRAGQVSWSAVGIFFLVAILGLLVWYFRVVLPPLLLAGALVFILNPVVTFLQHRGIPRALGTLISYVGCLGIAVGIGFLVAPIVTDQWSEMSDEIPQIREDVIDRWNQLAEDYPIPTIDEVGAQLGNSGGSLQDQAEVALSIGEVLLRFLLIVVLTPIIAFYLLVDLPHLRRVAESLIPDRAKAEVLVVAGRLNRAIGGFFRGQLVVALIVGTLVSIGLAIIDLPFWLIIGMIAGLFNMIPLIGPYIGGIPGVIIALTTGNLTTALLVVGIMVAAQQIDNHFITPYVMQRAVKLHPVLVILALLAGGTLFGFFGLLLAVPAMAAIKIIVSHLWRTHVLGEPIEEIVAAQAAADARGEGFIADVGGEEAKGIPPPREPAVEREVEPGLEPDLETETETEIEIASETETVIEPEPDIEPAPPIEPVPEPVIEPVPEPEPVIEPEPEPVIEPEPEPEPVIERVAADPGPVAGQGAPGTRVLRDGR